MNKKIIHAIAGTLAMLLIATFWTSTVISELFLDKVAVVAVKHYIAIYGVFCVVLLMATTGGSGISLGKSCKGRLIDEKKRRMQLIVANGVLIMIPAAIFLNGKAAADAFDTWFYVVQVVELAAGMVQLTLMGKNFRAGLRLSGHWRATLTK